MNQIALPDGPLVTAQWLAHHLPAVIVLDCSVERRDGPAGKTLFASGRRVFASQHIPGAGFADLYAGFSAPASRYPFTAPDAATLTAALQSLGVRATSSIILYDQLGGAYAARVWYLLHAVFGLARVRVLDGGLAAWRGISGQLEHGQGNQPPRGDIRLAAAAPAFATTASIRQSMIDGDRPLICALRQEQFVGQQEGDPRSGHIPGSYNLPFPAILDEQGRIDVERLRTGLRQLGLTSGLRPLLYCGGGINAAGLALAFAAAGHSLDDITIYDDSMNGWLDDPSLPVEQGPGKGIYAG